MTGILSIRYDSPAQAIEATAWGHEWRKRWFRSVGSVHQHYQTNQLVAFYSDSRDPAVRLALQAELEARPTGIAEVLAACCEVRDRFDREIREANERHRAAQAGV